MTTTIININMNVRCRLCGKLGAEERTGLCLKCLGEIVAKYTERGEGPTPSPDRKKEFFRRFGPGQYSEVRFREFLAEEYPGEEPENGQLRMF